MLNLKMLNLKSEKNASNAASKKQKTELNGLKQELNKMKQVRKDIEDELTEKSKEFKSKDVECKNLTNEKKELQERLDKSFSELDAIKNEMLHENNNIVAEVNFKCWLCDDKCESAVELSQHVRRNHYKDQISQTIQVAANVFTQTEDESETNTCEYFYPCFYCGKIISSAEELKMHLVECHESGLKFQDDYYREPYLQPPCFLPPYSFSSAFPLPVDFPCYTCDAKFKNKSEVRRHYNSSHADIILYWCDVCLTNFGSDRGLQSHMRNNHKGYF